MTLSETSFLSTNKFSQTEQVLHSEIGEYVKQMFVPTVGKSIETEIDDIVNDFTEEFLITKNANTNINLDLIIKNFGDSKIPLEPTDFESYFQYLDDKIVSNSIHTSSPQFIGHMTSALPSFVRPLAKLMTAMNQNAVKIETAKALSFCEREALAMMHRQIYNFSDNFYTQHIQNNQEYIRNFNFGWYNSQYHSAMVCPK
jgi:hypothetical protein